MKGRRLVMRVGLVIVLCCAPMTAFAETAPTVPALAIREVKITGDEFVVLQATADIPNLSIYWTGYSSSDITDAGVIVPTQQLPAYTLKSGQAVLMTSDGAEVCDAVITTKLSVSLGDTKGAFVVRELQNSGITSTFTTIDSVNWAKPSTTGTTQAQLDIRREATLGYAVWYHDPSFTKPWRVGNLAACTLILSPMATETAPLDTVEWLQAAVEPPAIIEASVEEGAENTATTGVNLNVGLAPPLITEILPNPLGTGNDSTDEFIELYNSNDQVFTLAGFTLQTGLATTHSWIIPVGVTIPAKSFKAFYANESGLSMSNTSGQATLLDTNGTTVAQSDPYDSSPDGQVWALASGQWYWSTKLTPGTTNVIAKPIVKAATATKKLATTTKTAVKGAATKASTSTKPSTSATNVAASQQTEATSALLHPLVLAAAATIAIGYGVYEYRHDLANAYHKLRRNRVFRRFTRR